MQSEGRQHVTAASSLALVVMAAGSGTRYGGLKQIEPLGPGGEAIVEYSLFDALRFGFRKVVFIIRHDIEEEFRSALGYQLEDVADVNYVFQDHADSRLAPVPPRARPWGTGHAVLAASGVLTEPFAVINADDYYGRDSFRVLSSQLRSGPDDAAMVGFRLRNTLSEFGPVRRALCTVARGKLQHVSELDGIEAAGQAVRCRDASGESRLLSGDEIVSMNMWGFHPSVFGYWRERWAEFAAGFGDSQDAEFYIPDFVSSLIRQRQGSCTVLPTQGNWFGITYREDRPAAVQRIAELVHAGEYPEKLWVP